MIVIHRWHFLVIPRNLDVKFVQMENGFQVSHIRQEFGIILQQHMMEQLVKYILMGYIQGHLLLNKL